MNAAGLVGDVGGGGLSGPLFDPRELSAKRHWELIGDGSFGNVYRAKLLGTNVAVKEIQK